MTITFDAANKLLVLSSQTTLDVKDAYSRWKDWVLLSDNSKYDAAFTAAGGDTIDSVAGTYVPCYAFLTNGWRVRPEESNHTLNVTGGVLLVSGGGDPFVNTVGSYIVRVNYQQPVQAITVSTGGGGGSWDEVIEGTLTARQMLRLISSVLYGKTEIVGSTATFRDTADSKDRVTATMTGSERTAIVLDPS